MNNICATCLATDRNLGTLQESAIFDILECLMVDKGYTNLAIFSKVCWECTAKLKNVIQFQDMAFHSLRRLEEYCKSEILYNGFTTNSLTPQTCLSETKLTNIDLPEDDEASDEDISKADDDEETDITQNLKLEDEEIDIKPNIKLEEEEFYEVTYFENDADIPDRMDSLSNVGPQLDENNKIYNNCTENEVTAESLLKKNEYCARLDDKNLEPSKTQLSNSKDPFALNRGEENIKTRMHKDLCDFNTPHNKELVRHIPKQTGEKPFKCDLCEYKTARKCHLKLHTYTHTGEKPFKCDLCEYKAASKCRLTEHTYKHAGEKPFKCDLCEYKAARKWLLTLHTYTHTGEKPFKCDICAYKSTTKSQIKKHSRIHTGEKPYKCDLCEHRAAYKSNLIIHRCIPKGVNHFK